MIRTSISQIPLDLNYFLLNKSRNVAPITLDLYEAEKYDSAVVVQQLIGNLVYYSNKGRYEFRIAESWERVSSTKWVFHLKNGFVCDNGEEINAKNFKASLELSIFTIGKKGPLPVFSKLEGYNKFLDDFTVGLDGIKAEGNTLTFTFTEPVRSGLIQLLSFAPFGYICKENRNPDGTWKDKLKFISSGAYRVKELVLGSKYILEKRNNWPIKNDKAPKIVQLTHDLSHGDQAQPSIIDTRTPLDFIPNGYSHFPLVPEYINLVCLGNLINGFFSDKNNRLIFREAINSSRNLFSEKWKNHIQVKTFYPTSEERFLNPALPLNRDILKETKELIIEGTEPQPNTSRWMTWKIAESALKKLNLKYKFANNEPSWAGMSNQNYDIRIRTPSVGSSVEAWGLDVIFCSPIGTKLPDPSGCVGKLITAYENNAIDYQQLSEQFLQTIEEDAAVLPISRHGMQWYVSNGIIKDSLSPLISVIRFDDLEME